MTGADLPLLAGKVKTCPGFARGLLLLPAERAARLPVIDQHGTVIKDLWLGMGDELSLEQRNCARTPMQWSSEAHGGFSRARKTLLPVIADGPYGREKINDKRARWSAHLLGPWF